MFIRRKLSRLLGIPAWQLVRNSEIPAGIWNRQAAKEVVATLHLARNPTSTASVEACASRIKNTLLPLTERTLKAFGTSEDELNFLMMKEVLLRHAKYAKETQTGLTAPDLVSHYYSGATKNIRERIARVPTYTSL